MCSSAFFHAVKILKILRNSSDLNFLQKDCRNLNKIKNHIYININSTIKTDHIWEMPRVLKVTAKTPYSMTFNSN